MPGIQVQQNLPHYAVFIFCSVIRKFCKIDFIVLSRLTRGSSLCSKTEIAYQFLLFLEPQKFHHTKSWCRKSFCFAFGYNLCSAFTGTRREYNDMRQNKSCLLRKYPHQGVACSINKHINKQTWCKNKY